MTPDRPLWLAPILVLIALAPLAWMGRQWVREWRAHKAGTLLPRGYKPPEPPTLHEPWRWRFLWLYAVQAVAIGGLTYGMVSDMGPKDAAGFVIVNIILVAFATAVLTRLWDRAAGLARRRSTASEGEQAPGKQVGVPAARGRLHQRP
ncbi:hypothetical protein [Methylobacterium sp. GC_Met_2]|uniref:hypothetical protein n=1 Tax=Methylobacterium sp. GC_Met_2 TaxID=2937376 RepID=UPI00226B2648|nr:hypothetical protein [Methylobacterium sp. GC_Met_2]